MIDPLKHFLIAMFYNANDVDNIFSKWNISKFDNAEINKKYACSISSNILKNTHYINDDKIELMARMFCDEWSKNLEDADVAQNLFFALYNYASSCLRMLDGRPTIKFESLFRWNELSSKLGQDMLLCSFVAYKNRYDSNLEYAHKIPLICGVDNKDLNFIYNKGLIELHQHLKASCDIFSLSWICLMNRVTGRLSNFKELDKENYSSLFKTFFQAARLRFYIFQYINGCTNIELDIYDKVEYYEIEQKLIDLQNNINICNFEDGQKIGNYFYDYAIKYNPFDERNASIYGGELFILYNAFKLIYRNPDNIKLTIALYKYLLDKTEIRKFFIQHNESVGFGNFKKFEGRKEIFLNNYRSYQKWCEILPLKESKQINKIAAIESRIAPKNNRREIINHQKNFYKQKEKIQNDFGKIDCCLIYHFIKENDKPFKEFYERHRSLRTKIRHQTTSIATAYKRNITVRTQTVGIDAANNELYCRPEVFAQAFRYLKDFFGDYYDYETFQTKALKSIGFTFHAGEDFYDIADGLRSIDEAIMFLQLNSGDRLGHCIALGQNTELFYSKHNNAVIISKQYLIDNCAWLIHKAKILNIKIEPKLEEYLLNTFEKLCNELYDKYINISTYHRSMLLRGDNPREIFSENNKTSFIKDWNFYNLDSRTEFCNARNDKEAKEIYYAYHYDKNVRCRGEEVSVFKVDCSYIKLIEEIQDAMMDEIERKEIIIECCPTSNFKIGTNNKYEDLPIFRFNTIDSNRHNLRVTINTDDLGIFHTSLDKEFSLVALSALKKKSKDGNLLYQNHQIYQWLDRIRENGEKYRFSKEV